MGFLSPRKRLILWQDTKKMLMWLWWGVEGKMPVVVECGLPLFDRTVMGYQEDASWMRLDWWRRRRTFLGFGFDGLLLDECLPEYR